jgi:hypothetical protein
LNVVKFLLWIKLLSEGKQIGLIFAARKVEKQIVIAICFLTIENSNTAAGY